MKILWITSVLFPKAESLLTGNIVDLTASSVTIGNNVTIKSGVQIWDGVTIEDNVFIGPNVTFTNDLFPRSKQYPESFAKTIIKKGASIGANATIIAGHTIGENVMIGAGAVVTKDVPAGEIWVGNPAKKLKDMGGVVFIY